VPKKYPVCGTRTGWHCCCKSWQQSSFDEYGVGLVLYFKFLKFLIVLFFLLSIGSTPAYYFYFNGNSADNSEYSSAKYYLAAFSLGNIGACKTPRFHFSLQPKKHATVEL